jgi:hypothetical protein
MSTGSFHDGESRATEAVLERFNQFFLTHDPAALAELVAEDCVIENTEPAPSAHPGEVKSLRRKDSRQTYF